MEGSLFLLLCGAIIFGRYVYDWYMAEQERQKEDNFKLQHPKEYAQLKQMEHERQIMVHDEKRMRHENAQTGAGLFSTFFRGFWS